jgi:hypothetical protein
MNRETYFVVETRFLGATRRAKMKIRIARKERSIMTSQLKSLTHRKKLISKKINIEKD